MLISRSVRNPDAFRIEDKAANRIYFGCDQKWYPRIWQRLSGCGPSVACNIALYLMNNNPDRRLISKEKALAVMEEVWGYVTPGAGGMARTAEFYTAVQAYFKSKNTDIRYACIDIPDKKSPRPEFSEVSRFIAEALVGDAPVAFLNLDQGKIKDLDSWHWVTIISIEYEADGSAALIRILDEGRVKSIDLKLWYDTTKRGGGFVCFHRL